MGWASIHTAAAQEVLPTASSYELQCARMEAASAISMIGVIMGDCARDYLDLSGGIWIGDQPAVLALFFNTGRNLLTQSAARRRLNACSPGMTVTLDISQNPMARWVSANLSRFAEFRTNPAPPSGTYAQVIVE
jgi:hypothetical protein